MAVKIPGIHACEICQGERNVRRYTNAGGEAKMLCGPCRYHMVSQIQKLDWEEIKDIEKLMRPEVKDEHQEYCGDCGLPLGTGREECLECGSLLALEALSP